MYWNQQLLGMCQLLDSRYSEVWKCDGLKPQKNFCDTVPAIWVGFLCTVKDGKCRNPSGCVDSSPLRHSALMAVLCKILKTATRWCHSWVNPTLQNRYSIMGKCLNIGKHNGKTIYQQSLKKKKMFNYVRI